MYDPIDQQQAMETLTRIMSRPRRASFSSSSSQRHHHHRSSSAMSRSSAPLASLRRLNASAPNLERGRTLDEYDSPSSKMPRPFVPEMKEMRPFILNSTKTPPRPDTPFFPPQGTGSNRSSISESRSREPSLPRQVQDNSKHPFDATDHVIMKMEFVRPPLDVEELWVECFERWSKIHRKATAAQWRWLYENRVLPTETAETFPRKPPQLKNPGEAGIPLRTSRSLGLIESDNDCLKMPPKASSLAARRVRRKTPGKVLDLERTPRPLDLDISRPSALYRDQGYYAKDGTLTPVYYGHNDKSVSHATGSYRKRPSETVHNNDEPSSDDSLESMNFRESIETTATSVLSYPNTLGRHSAWAEGNSKIYPPVDKLELPGKPDSCFEIDSEDEDDLVSISSASSRHSIASFDEGYVPTPLTAIPAKAYSNPQKVQVWRSSSQSSEYDFQLSLLPEALRVPNATSVPMSVVDNQPKFTPWASSLNTPPMSPEHYSNVLEYNQNLTTSDLPRKSSLAHESSQPLTPQRRYSTTSDDSSDMTPGSPPFTPSDDYEEEQEEDFATPTQESVSRESLRDLPKVRLDLLIKTPSQSPATASFNSNEHPIRHPPILPSQIDSFSAEDESILNDLEKAVCGPIPSLFLSTPCITHIRTMNNAKSDLQAFPPNTNLIIANNSRPSITPRLCHIHPLKSHPPNIPHTLINKTSMGKVFGQATAIRPHQPGEGISNVNPKHQHQRLQSQDLSPNNQPQTPTPPDLSSFRIIFPQTTDSKRDQLYAYLLAYTYLLHLPTPTSHHHHHKNPHTKSKPGTTLSSPFHSTTKLNILPPPTKLPELPTPETIITEKAAATLGIMSSEESLRTVRLEFLVKGLVDRVREGISRLVGEMDLVGKGRGRGEGYVVERTLLRTLVEHVGVLEENGKLGVENGGLWRRIFWRVRDLGRGGG